MHERNVKGRHRLGSLVLVAALVLSSFMVVTLMTPQASAARYGMDTNLSQVDASFIGEANFDVSGQSIAGVGDVNGDGYDDFVIGANANGEAGIAAGQTYLLLGKETGWTNDTSLGEADASFLGEGGQSGWSVAGAGDVNGDGYDDILIGAPYNDENGPDAGQTYLVLGKASGWSMDIDLTNSDASFLGEAPGDKAGEHIDGAGDVNGDGYDDILIGAYGNDDGGDHSGQTYLVLGGTTGWSMDTNLSNSDASYRGEAAGDRSGMRLAGAGDVNGDGYDDFVIGAYGNDENGVDAGQTYLVLGKASGWSMDTSLSTVDASFLGEDDGDGAGYVGAAGDVNGDGYDDLLIGSTGDDEGGPGTGQVYLVLGRTTGWSMDTNISGADASFWGEAKDDNLGYNNAGVGDVNGDGYDDFLLGAGGNDEGGIYAGQAYLILGRATGWAMHANVSGANASFIGEHPRASQGYMAVSGAGDVNGDGYHDLLVGCSWNDEGGSRSGQTYLIFFDQADRDNDGVPDADDVFPDNPFEAKDTDGDGMGDNLDPDADGDNVRDERDAFPLDRTEWMDTDGDGTGDNTDADDDNDGINDTSDAFPRNPFEFHDADKDGIGDNLDPDDDGDGRSDADEMRATVRRDMSTVAALASTVQSSLEGDLHGMDASLMGTLSSLETGFLAELAAVNATLASGILSSVRSINDRVSTLDTSVTGDIEDLRVWMDQLLTALDDKLVGTNATLMNQMDQVERNAGNLYDTLSTDIFLLKVRLGRIDSDLADEDAGIRADIAALSAMLADLEGTSLAEMGVLMDRLSANVSAYDQSTADDLARLSADIAAFEQGTGEDIAGIETSLGELATLGTILADLEALDADLKAAQEELDRSVQDAGDEQTARSHLNMALVVLVIALLAVALLLLLTMKRPSLTASLRLRREEDIIVSADSRDEGGDIR